MPVALDKIFAEVSDFTRTMGSIHGNFLKQVKGDIDQFLEKTKDLSKQMFWQGWAIVGLTGFAASLAIAGTLIPKSGPAANTPPLDRRLNANDGIKDGFSKAMNAISKQLKNNEFLSTTCKTTSQFFNDGVTTAVKNWYHGATSKIEAAKALLQSVNISDGQTKKGMTFDAVQRAQQAVLTLLEKTR